MSKSQSEKFMRGVSGFGGTCAPVANNQPAQYGSRQTQYMAQRTRAYDEQRAYLSADYFEAEVQGLTDDFYTWTKANVRLADVSKKERSSLNSQKSDDRKVILFPDRSIEYFPIGAKIKTAGSVWLCINPSNISSAKSTAIVARCNASYNSYDEYGNIVTEPIVVESYQMTSNDNTNPSNIVLMDGYFKVICQLNDNTAKLHENSRLILGTKAYHITGVTNFMQEFSGDRSSCHYVTFNARVEEPTETDDITEHFIAGGRAETFEVSVVGNAEISVNNQTQLFASFIHNDVSEEIPLTWQWSSTNEEIATVDENGVVTGVAEGSVEIVATLEQNKELQGIFKLVVSAFQTESVSFTSIIPTSLKQFEQVEISAAVFIDGKISEETPLWQIEGEDGTYDADFGSTENSMIFECLKPSDTPLKITVGYGSASKTVEIELEGY